MGLFKKRTVSEPTPSTSSLPVSTTSFSAPTVPISSDKTNGKKSVFDFLINPNRVTEATLAVWRNLPGEIRQDPSMINFQREAERWKGMKNKIQPDLVECQRKLVFCSLIGVRVNVPSRNVSSYYSMYVFHR